jgi:hypothetical protein
MPHHEPQEYSSDESHARQHHTRRRRRKRQDRERERAQGGEPVQHDPVRYPTLTASGRHAGLVDEAMALECHPWLPQEAEVNGNSDDEDQVS